MDKEMKIQTDREFEQNETKRLNQKYNIQIFSSKDCGRKVAEQKTREFKKLLFKEKVLDKPLKKVKPKKLISQATSNLNNIKLIKYGFASEQIESKSIKDHEFKEKYNFHMLQKV